tara:strand:- start:104 stop:1141 length:1038 start_codon:yes stop_codon:yes gene_type:complete
MAEDTGWQVYRNEWYNDRVMETFINAPIIDKQNDLIPTDVLKESMDFYMKYGIYSYQHEELPVGLPLAYRIEDDKIKVRYGIHNKLEMHDKVWDEIKDFGTKGASSIRGETLTQDIVCPEGAESCFNKINDIGLWSVSWVGDNPANTEAKVTNVALAKNGGLNDSKNELRTLLDIKEADTTVSFINKQSDMELMSKVKKDCECSSEKEAEEEVKADKEEEEIVAVEVISPEELPDVVEEEIKEEDVEELTLEGLADELKSLKETLDGLTPKQEEAEEELLPEEEAKSNEPSLDVVMKSLKKYGISVYAGAKRTPAPAIATPKATTTDWNNMSKTWDELEEMIGDN